VEYQANHERQQGLKRKLEEAHVAAQAEIGRARDAVRRNRAKAAKVPALARMLSGLTARPEP